MVGSIIMIMVSSIEYRNGIGVGSILYYIILYYNYITLHYIILWDRFGSI